MTVKKKWWAPRKLNDRRIKSADKILNEELNIIILTDEELCILINEWVEEEDRISYRTFQYYKADINGWKNIDDNIDIIDEERETLWEFLRLYKKALITQRKNLFKKMSNSDEKQRQKYAWIIERKFSEWNLRIISEVDNKHSWDITIKRGLSNNKNKW